MNDLQCRRIVTGLSSTRASVLVSDGPAADAFAPAGIAGLLVADLWATEGIPDLSQATVDPVQNRPTLLPPPGGTRWRLVQHAPGSLMRMHATNTFDYIFVISGEVILRVAGHTEDLVLKPGDCVVEGGAQHEWENRSELPCTTLVMSVGASVT